MAKAPDLLISFDTPARPLRKSASMPLIPRPNTEADYDPFEFALKMSLQLGKKKGEKNESSRRKKSKITHSKEENNNNINVSITDKEIDSEVVRYSQDDSIILGGSEFLGFSPENLNRSKTKLNSTFRVLSDSDLSQCLNSTKTLNATFSELRQEAIKMSQIFKRLKPKECAGKRKREEDIKFSLDRTFIGDVKPLWLDSFSSEDNVGLPKVKRNSSLTSPNLKRKKAESNLKKKGDSLNCSEGNSTFTIEKEGEECTSSKMQKIVVAPKELQPKKQNVTGRLITKKNPLKSLIPLKKITPLGARKLNDNSNCDKTNISHKGIKADSEKESANMIKPVAASTPDKTRSASVLKILVHKDPAPKKKISPLASSSSNSRGVLSALVTSDQTKTKPGNKVLLKNLRVKKTVHDSVKDKENRLLKK